MNDYNIQEYSREIIDEVMQESQYEGINPEVQFTQTRLEVMEDIGEFDEFVIIEDGIDGAGRWKINGYAITTENTRLCCFITDFENTDTPTTFVNTDVKKLVKKIEKYIDIVLKSDLIERFEPGSEVFVAGQNIKQTFSLLNKIEVFIITNKIASKRLNHLPDDSIFDIPTFVHLWDLERFYQLEMSGKEREAMIVEFPKPVRCLVTSESKDNTISCLVVMDGPTLFDIYKKWQSRLLERNVRTYLQNRSKVNKGIIETIKSEPEKFFAYNNGLTTTADNIEFSNDEQTHIKSLTNFQIVNGAQTTSSIYAAVVKDKADISKISVQMKLTVVMPETVDELVPKISRFANSQNKVSDADFFSNHEFHIEFEKLANRMAVTPKPGISYNTFWFYERARGQYLNQQAYMSPSEKRKWRDRHPRNQLITKTDLAKFENSWAMEPALVSKGAQANFNNFANKVESQWSKNKAIFGELYFKKCIVHAIIFKALESAIPKKDWYSGFRANIITYTISYFSKWLIDNKLNLDYMKFYKTQECPIILIEVLCDIATHVNTHLHSVEQNLTTYAKGKSAWINISAIDIPFRSELISKYLIAENKLKDLEKQSTKQQKQDNKLYAEAKIMQLKVQDWIRIKEYIINMDMSTPKTIGILGKATQYEGAILGLSERQKGELIKLLQVYEKDKGPITI
jgi:hypothetical protein